MQLPDLRAGLASLSSCSRAHSLYIEVPFVSPAMGNFAVMAMFSEHKDLIGLTVVENGAPFGMINRHSTTSRRLVRAVTLRLALRMALTILACECGFLLKLLIICCVRLGRH